MNELAVVIPTRNRPEMLSRCLAALEQARYELEFEVYVCDSSDTSAVRERVRVVCEPHSWARYVHHLGTNVAAARNVCARVAETAVLVNVDDDLLVEPGAVRLLYEAYRCAGSASVVAGSVNLDGDWSTPVVMRRIGYGRPASPGETASFVLGAFFLYPRALALQFPWNERIRTSDDRFMGAVWRRNGIQIRFEPNARALHDHQVTRYGAEVMSDHIYANLFDALIANPRILTALEYEFLGFAAGVKKFGRSPTSGARFVRAWALGHLRLARDWRALTRYRSACANG